MREEANMKYNKEVGNATRSEIILVKMPLLLGLHNGMTVKTVPSPTCPSLRPELRGGGSSSVGMLWRWLIVIVHVKAFIAGIYDALSKISTKQR